MAAYQDYYGQDVKFELNKDAFILDNIDILCKLKSPPDTLTYRYMRKNAYRIWQGWKNENLKLTVVEYVEDYLELANGVIPNMKQPVH